MTTFLTFSPVGFMKKIWPPRRKATVSPRGEIAGACPSVRRLAGVCSNPTDQISCAGLVGLQSGFGFSAAVFKIAAAREQQITSIGSPSKFVDLLTIVPIEVRDPAAGPIGRLGDPDIAFTFIVLKPRDSGSIGGREWSSRERRAHHLANRKRARSRGRADNSGQRQESQKIGFHRVFSDYRPSQVDPARRGKFVRRQRSRKPHYRSPDPFGHALD